ncbi:MAG: hypothetical protein P9L91_09400 [Candidatus Zophobacter franzmannii]|nr:hypothetical protein [Candidatus Zophobacter franzmannii]
MQSKATNGQKKIKNGTSCSSDDSAIPTPGKSVQLKQYFPA